VEPDFAEGYKRMLQLPGFHKETGWIDPYQIVRNKDGEHVFEPPLDCVIAALRDTNGMKAVNRAMFYCLRLEPAFQLMNQASKANVYIRAKTASAYAGSLSFVTQDVDALSTSTGLGLSELAKKAYYLNSLWLE